MSSEYFANYGWYLKMDEDILLMLGLTKKAISDIIKDAENENYDFDLALLGPDNDIMDFFSILACGEHEFCLNINGQNCSVEAMKCNQFMDFDGYCLEFDEDDLFIKTPTPLNEFLIAKNSKPNFHNWVSCV